VFGFELDTRYNLLPGGTAYFLGNKQPFSGVWGAAGVQSQLMSQGKVWLRVSDGCTRAGADTAGWHAPSSQTADAQTAVSPRIVADEFGYQLESEKLARYFEAKAQELGVAILDDPLAEVLHDARGVTGLRLRSGQVMAADLYVDGTGSEAALLGKSLAEPFYSYEDALCCDRAAAGTWQRAREPLAPYTSAKTMSTGWCWRAEHERRLTGAYFYSSRFTREEEAEAEFRAENPRVRSTRTVSFQCGRYARAWVKNVVAIGAAAAVVEPLADTALAAICLQCQALAEVLLQDRGPKGTQTRQGEGATARSPSPVSLADAIAGFNDDTARGYDAIRDFLALHYRFNSRLDTPFWRECQEQVQLHGAGEVVDTFRKCGPSPRWRCDCAADRGWGEFGTEGYLALLVGLCVPYHASYAPSEQDRKMWAIIQQAIRQKVASALSVTEALALVRSDSWKWPEGIYDRSRTLRP
jgi:tryptophan halogenase